MHSKMTVSRETFAKALRTRCPEVTSAAASSFVDEAVAAHPEIRSPDATAFAEAVLERLEGKKLEQLNAADLFLAQGSVRGDPAALRAFARLCRQRVPRVLASMRPTAMLVEEVEERLQEKLVVSTGGKPGRLAGYQGTGSLAAWVGVAAVRIAIELTRLKRNQDQAPFEEGSGDAKMTSGDPEFDLLKSSHSKRFKEAFEAAFVKLTLEDRNLLRMHLKDGLSIDQLGVMFQIHRATAARRISRAKDTLLEGLRGVLAAKFQMSDAEIDSDLRTISPSIDLSLSRLLIAGKHRG